MVKWYKCTSGIKANWESIHKDFGIDGQMYDSQSKWEKLGFDYEETKKWVESGLGPIYDYELAYFLRGGGCKPGKRSWQEWQELAKECKEWLEKVTVQEWLNYLPLEKKKDVIELRVIDEDKLEGYLKIEGFTNLKLLNCSKNKITNLEIIDCPYLEIIDCSHNQITELNVEGCPNLKLLSCSNNLLTGLDLSKNRKLETLFISNNNFPAQDLSFLLSSNFMYLKQLSLGNHDKERMEKGIYNRFTGSLEPLKNMTKLELFSINCTDLEMGLEYLPSSVKTFCCSAKLQKDSKVLKIYNLFANEEGEVETNSDGWSIKDLPQKLQVYKRKLQEDKLYNSAKNLPQTKEQQSISESTIVSLPKSQVQEWLNENYPYEQRENIEKLDLSNLSLEGDLDLFGFFSLQEVNISGNPRLGEVVNTRVTKVKMSAQEWLNKRFSDKKEVKEIKLWSKDDQEKIEGELIIGNFPQLETITFLYQENLTKLQVVNCPQLTELNCWNSQLNHLEITNSPKLKILKCTNNFLMQLDLGQNRELEILEIGKNYLNEIDLSQNKKLKRLGISNNNFADQDLSFLSHLINLEYLNLENTDKKRIEQGIYNRFVGSLKHLQNLVRLEFLDINNTDINSGVEYLSSSLSKISYSAEERSQSKVKEIAYQLNLFTSKKQKQQRWKELGFTQQEIKQWMETGLKINDYEYAFYLLNRGWTSEEFANRRNNIQLREEFEKWKKNNEIKYMITNSWRDCQIEKRNNFTSIHNMELPKLIVSESGKISLPKNYQNVNLYKHKGIVKMEKRGYTVVSNRGGSTYVLFTLGVSNYVEKNNQNDKRKGKGPRLVYDSTERKIVEWDGLPYVCVSYAWNTIGENGAEKLIKVTRQASNIDLIWIDKLCVSEEIEQKGKDIADMAAIYSQADMCIAVVGIETIEELKKMEKYLVDPFELWKNPSGGIGGVEMEEKVKNFAEAIMKEEWFSRLWTVQEAVLAKELWLTDIDCNTRMNLTVLFEKMAKSTFRSDDHWSKLSNMIFTADGDMEIIDHGQQSWILLNRLTMEFGGAHFLELAALTMQLREEQMPLANALKLATTRFCSVKRDLLYAILSLTKCSRHVPDYTRDWSEELISVQKLALKENDFSWFTSTVYPQLRESENEEGRGLMATNLLQLCSAPSVRYHGSEPFKISEDENSIIMDIDEYIHPITGKIQIDRFILRNSKWFNKQTLEPEKGSYLLVTAAVMANEKYVIDFEQLFQTLTGGAFRMEKEKSIEARWRVLASDILNNFSSHNFIPPHLEQQCQAMIKMRRLTITHDMETRERMRSICSLSVMNDMYVYQYSGAKPQGKGWWDIWFLSENNFDIGDTMLVAHADSPGITSVAIVVGSDGHLKNKGVAILPQLHNTRNVLKLMDSNDRPSIELSNKKKETKQQIAKEKNDNFYKENVRRAKQWGENINIKKEKKKGSENDCDWKNIHLDFKDTTLIKTWQSEGFNFKQTKEWIDIGLTSKEVEFAIYLEEQGKTPEQCLNCEDIGKLREEYASKKEIKITKVEGASEVNKNNDDNNISDNETASIIKKQQPTKIITTQSTEQIELQPLKPALPKPNNKNSSQSPSTIQLVQEEPETTAQTEANNDWKWPFTYCFGKRK